MSDSSALSHAPYTHTSCTDDGSMNKVERDASVDKITNSRSTRVILISFKAGSTGLNLTCCNNVILVDPWWNPALEVINFARFAHVQS